MPQINVVLMSGRLGRDPEIKYTPNGKAVVNFSMANSRGYGDKQSTTWVNVTAWGKTAEYLAENAKKGDEVIVQGFLEVQEWENNEGEKRSKTLINTIWGKVDLLKSRKKGEPGGNQGPSEKDSGLPNIPEDDIPF